jgi:high-affinity nickel-transport protein
MLGVTLGIRHAADPDHVTAIAALVARHRRPAVAAGIGAAWGLGHSLVIFAVGGALVALHVTAVPAWARAAELAVAAILVALGISNFRSLRVRPIDEPIGGGPIARAPTLRSVAIGMAHGLAGSAAVALLALAAMPSPSAAIAYLAAFGLGTLVSMVAMSLGLGLPVSLAGRRPALARWLVAGSGGLSIGVGIYLAVA